MKLENDKLKPTRYQILLVNNFHDTNFYSSE